MTRWVKWHSLSGVRGIGLVLVVAFTLLAQGSNTVGAVATNQDARERLAQLLTQWQSHPDDEALLSRIIELATSITPPPPVPEEAAELARKARASVEHAHSRADYDAAIEALEQAVRLAPWVANLYLNLGLVHEKAGQYDAAVRSFERYLQAKPDASSQERAEVHHRIQAAQAASGRGPTGRDGAPMVLMPAGSFWMGSTENEIERALDQCMQGDFSKDFCQGGLGIGAELPRHQVTLDAFYLDKYEVTNNLFQKFVRDTGHETTAEREGWAWALLDVPKDLRGANWRKPEGGETVFALNRQDHPVISVSWYDAEAYCRWAGKRLPTEAEFEYATRAGTQTAYWWGELGPGSRRVGNLGDEAVKRQFPTVNNYMVGYDDGYVRTAPVGSFEPNPWGLHDMIGNVIEWVADWYDGNYYNRSPRRNPIGPERSRSKVARGGSWFTAPFLSRSASRAGFMATERQFYVGFRCAKDSG